MDATVYLVDDDDAVRHSLVRLLRAAGWRTEAFATAREFLAQAPIETPGCALLDVQLPGMTGLELHRRMDDAGIHLPVVFLTGQGDIPMSVNAMKNGAVDFLVKPVDEAILFKVLHAALEQGAAQRAARDTRASITARLARLSDREHEVLERVLRGNINKQIATELGIAEKTVKAHRGRVMEKMEAGSLAELVHMCDAAGVKYLP